jgi:hypothetical protein
MPFKTDADRRHRIPQQRQKVTIWAEYDAGHCQAGGLYPERVGWAKLAG